MSAINHHPDYRHVILRGDGLAGLPRMGDIKTIDSLAEHLQAALRVELCTIPLYLTAEWSVQDIGTDDMKRLAKDVHRELFCT